jgi:RNA polymerase sigma-70 factor (ECF subfamily)
VTSQDDAALISRVLVFDDRHAFATLVRRHQSAIRAFLTRLCCGDRATADDLAQETFLRAYRRLPSYQQRGSFGSWLFALSYRAFLSDKRRGHWTREVAADESASAAVGHGPDAVLDIANAMASLRPEERAALSLCAQHGLSHEEAAQVLGFPVGTVKTHILRGKAKLRSPLAAYASRVTSSMTEPESKEV